MSRRIPVLSLVLLLAGFTAAHAANVTVTIENMNPQGGIYLAPTWVAFHDGSYNLYTLGSTTTPGLVHLARDGASDQLSAEFMAAEPSGTDGVVTDPVDIASPPVFDPGNINSATFTVDGMTQRYFTFAAMVVPSNDAFVGSSAPVELFDAGGNFLGPITMILYGNDILDAGGEQNTEMDAAFINQMMAGDGIVTNDPVMQHPGYIGSERNPGGTPIILGGTNPLGVTFDPVLADFTRNNGTTPQFRITITPEPASLALITGLLPLLAARRRRRRFA